MFNKISQMLGNAVDFGNRLMKPMKNHISTGWDMLKNGASKVGRFVNDNHQAIGTILSGVGNIISGMPNSPLKQKLQTYGDAAGRVKDSIYGGYNGYNRRPINTPYTQSRQNMRPAPGYHGLKNPNSSVQKTSANPIR